MLNDEQFNALEWAELTDIQELAGAKIEDIEPIGDGAATCCGIVLYLKRMDGSKAAISICAPLVEQRAISFSMAAVSPTKTTGNPPSRAA